jgi:L-alanine-DL-glutamate epimerase-like enolase superfamily enzyme
MVDGMLILPKTPGLGFGFDEKAVARYALKGGNAVWKVLK